MNQNPLDDSLDNILRQWADEREVGPEHLDNLQDRILSAIHDEPTSAEQRAAGCGSTSTVSLPAKTFVYQRRPVSLRRVSLVGRLIGATLLALVAFIWSAQSIDVGGRRLQIVEATRPKFPDYAQLDDDQLDDRMIVLSGMKDVFGDQLTWLAETDSRFEVGLSGNPQTTETSLAHNDIVEIAVRVVVEDRTSPESGWRRAWSVDVISQNEEVVKLAAKYDDSTTMTVWAYVLPDGMVAIDSELEFSSGSTTASSATNIPFHAVFSNVQKDRQPSEELLTGVDGVEYRILRTVAVLNKKVG